ncbi:MAG: acyl-ACP--UDP-N-acetylglucosamine O-acyltransferase [Acidobacteriota bacterium]|nr:acyl-ACP--UDP-N-acetylglucosamine O-acyltransferase [Acidobacteriota bacterium]
MASDKAVIHPAAVVDPAARIGEGVFIGPFCVIGPHAAIGPRTRLESHVVVEGWTTIGADNSIGMFSVLGTPPQDVGYKGEETRVVIGDRNVLREYVTVHRATTKEERLTSLGSDNYIMANAHIAHDCRVGNRVILINGATLGGHVHVGDEAMISAFTGIHQFSRIGRYAFIGGYSVITQDVLPFSRVVGQRPARVFGMNIVGLRRKGFGRERIAAIKEMFHLLFYSGLNTAQAVEAIRTSVEPGPDREEILGFTAASKRGLIKKTAESWENESD